MIGRIGSGSSSRGGDREGNDAGDSGEDKGGENEREEREENDVGEGGGDRDLCFFNLLNKCLLFIFLFFILLLGLNLRSSILAITSSNKALGNLSTLQYNNTNK